jgi:hypothetical protein
MAFKNKFDGGEIDKWCLGAVDDPMYQRGLAWLENFTLLNKGGLNRRRGYKYISRILNNTTDGAVKLIPYMVNDSECYLIYVSKSRFGYLTFSGYDMTKIQENEWPPAPVIPSGNVVEYKARDPEAYYDITGISNMDSVDELNIGTEFDIGGLSQVEAGRGVITSKIEDSFGKLASVSSFSVEPAAALFSGDITQTPAAVSTGNPLSVSYFDEEGAGSGLLVSCSSQKQGDESILSFTVLNPGVNFTADKGKNSTTLNLVLEELGSILVKATVNSAGGISAINDYKMQGYPQFVEGIDTCCLRYRAPPIEEGIYSDVCDWADRKPSIPPNIKVWVNEVAPPDVSLKEIPTLGDLYEITFGEEDANNPGYGTGRVLTADGGAGFIPTNWLWADPDPGGPSPPPPNRPAPAEGEDPEPEPYPLPTPDFLPRIPVCFIKINFLSEVSNQACFRELRVAARLDRQGRITYIYHVPFWLDDEIALSGYPTAAPYAEGGAMSKLRPTSYYQYPPDPYPPKPDPPEPVEGDDPAPPDPPDAGGTWNASYLIDNQKRILGLPPLYGADKYVGWGNCIWRGVEVGPYYRWNTNYKEVDLIKNTRWIIILQAWHGIWYMTHSIGFSGDSIGFGGTPWREKQDMMTRYPLALIGNRDGILVDSMQYNASGCPKLIENPNMSCKPYAQWYEGEKEWIAPLAYNMERMRVNKDDKTVNVYFDIIDRWYMNDPRNIRDDDGNSFSKLLDAETRKYTIEQGGAYKGSGAVLNVRSSYTKPVWGSDSEGVMAFRIELERFGKGYLTRGVSGINLWIWYSNVTDSYFYKVPVIASRGTDGMLVLRKPDGTPAEIDPATGNPFVIYYADARMITKPPSDNSNLTISNAAAEVIVKAAVTAVGSGGLLNRWDVVLSIEKSAKGIPLTPSLFRVGDYFNVSWGSNNEEFTLYNAVRALSIFKTFKYAAALLSGGKFKKDISKTNYTGVLDGHEYSIYISGAKFNTRSTLFAVTNPNSSLYKVNTDESMGLYPSYWEWRDAAWKERVIQVFPSTDEQVNGIQYVFTGKYFILCGLGITPLTLEITDDNIILGEIGAVTDVSFDITKPPECNIIPANSVSDEALPLNFMRSVQFSPSVMAYINGRLWVSGLMDDASRIYVSKPQNDKSSHIFDFTTYKIFLTVTPEYTPFKARNTLGSNIISGADSGALGLMIQYAQNVLRGKKVEFGYNEPFIMATPYFASGARAVSFNSDIVLNTNSVALPGEYTEAAMSELRSTTSFYLALSRLRVSVPGAFCMVSADCEGFEIQLVNWHAIVPLPISTGPITTGQRVPWTSWGGVDAEAAGVIAGAASSAGLLAFGLSSPIVAVSAAAILGIAYNVIKPLLEMYMGKVKLVSTDGNTLDASLNEMGMSYRVPSSIQAKCDYLLNKYKLYEDIQPFLLRRWMIDEKEYSTPECGFTFKCSSEESEGVSIISDNRSIFIGTESGERIMPSNADGEAQSARTGSFFGAEKIQAAKAVDALYYVQKGGQSIMRAAYQPNVPIPIISDVQSYNKEILRYRKVIGIKSSKVLPVTVWCIMADGSPAVITDNGYGGVSWSRISSEGGAILDTAVLSMRGKEALRIAAVKNDSGFFIAGIPEGPGMKADIFLDLWQEYLNVSLVYNYMDNAVVFDEESGSIVMARDIPAPGGSKYIGYLYTSKFRTLPVEAALAMKPARAARARFRFIESALPFIRGFPSGDVNKIVSPGDERFIDGIADIPVPGNVELDAAFEVFTDLPFPLSIIAMSTEEDA